MNGPAATITLTAPAGTVTGVVVPPVLLPVATITFAAAASSADAYTIDRSGDVITLTLIDTDVPLQPGTLHVNVGNGPASGTAYFFLDGSTSDFFSVDLDDTGTALAVEVPIDGLSVGTHTLEVGAAAGTPEATSSQSFTVDTAQPGTTTGTPNTPPLLTTTKWTFQAYDYADPMAIPTYTFTYNPSTLSQEFGNVSLTHEPTTSHGGNLVTWEGAPVPGRWVFSGRVDSKADHDALLAWANLNQRVWLTDEFSRRYLIKIEDLQMVRKRNISKPWDHDYTMSVTVLAGQGIPS